MKIQSYLPSKIRINSNLTVLGHKMQGEFQRVCSIKPLSLGQSVNHFRNSTRALAAQALAQRVKPPVEQQRDHF
jgi:hypothetical protein